MQIDWASIISQVRDWGLVIGLIAGIWKISGWFSSMKTQLENICQQVNNHIPSEIKNTCTKIDKLDTEMTDKIISIHNRINVHDKDIGELQGLVKAKND